ncbi:MAG: 2OG-Fe(II) oxygenase [Myxococcota bacterium]|nr:2OG-Fe(II) oxygenase [Myxococcota bacterium]
MPYIDYERLEGLDPEAYQSGSPYPWTNPEGILLPEAYQSLYQNLPDLSLFTRHFGVDRKAGQQPHDRFTLEYTSALELPKPWEEFVAELKSDRYRRALCRLVGVRNLALNFHWHYTPNGCSVSPHCDSKRKLGSHIFYFNDEKDWKPEWGGETVILDDGGRFPTKSAPAFEDFDRELSSVALGNHSLIFTRRGNSWHGVKEIRCPEGHMRKVFIVVLNRADALGRLRARLSGKGFERY